jgi:hypothetical protein
MMKKVMNNSLMKKYYLTFGLLLCFGIIHAQLSQYEYWFDDNFAGRVTRSIGGSDASISELDAAHLSDGLHYWHLRVKNTDGSYSGITSGVFFKSLLGTDAKLEYWYNDDFESRKLIPSPAGEDISVNEDLDLFDMPSGLNRLNMRVANGAVSASYLMKTEVGATDKLEYWYNDDFESRTLVSPAEVGETAENGRLDVRAMPLTESLPSAFCRRRRTYFIRYEIGCRVGEKAGILVRRQLFRQ